MFRELPHIPAVIIPWSWLAALSCSWDSSTVSSVSAVRRRLSAGSSSSARCRRRSSDGSPSALHTHSMLSSFVDVKWRWSRRLCLCRRHRLKILVPETCATNLHKKFDASSWKFFAPNNSPANHAARLVSHAKQFLCWNRAVLNCVQETYTRKKLVQDWPTHVQVSGTRRLAPVSWCTCHRH